MHSSIQILGRTFDCYALYSVPYEVTCRSGKDITVLHYNSNADSWRIGSSHFRDNPSSAKETNKELLKFAETSTWSQNLKDMKEDNARDEVCANLRENIIRDTRKLIELKSSNDGVPEHVLQTIIYLLDPPDFDLSGDIG